MEYTSTQMRKSGIDDIKQKFLQIYADLPFGLRKEIIAVVDDEPFTWNSAKIEIENDTDIGEQILDKLSKLEIIR